MYLKLLSFHLSINLLLFAIFLCLIFWWFCICWMYVMIRYYSAIGRYKIATYQHIVDGELELSSRQGWRCAAVRSQDISRLVTGVLCEQLRSLVRKLCTHTQTYRHTDRCMPKKRKKKTQKGQQLLLLKLLSRISLTQNFQRINIYWICGGSQFRSSINCNKLYCQCISFKYIKFPLVCLS